MIKRLLVMILLVAMQTICVAADSPELINESKTEATLRHVAEQLRCPVCQSENVYDSKAPLAGEMRRIIREQISAGKSEVQIIEFFVSRYGSYVLQEPPKTGPQLMIWIAPFLLGLISVGGLTWWLRRSVNESVGNELDAATDAKRGSP